MAALDISDVLNTETGANFGPILQHFQHPNVPTVVDMESGAHYLRYETDILPFTNLMATQVLGSGLNGQVLLLEEIARLNDMKLAAKIFSFSNADPDKNDEMKKIFLKECGLLQSIKHKNIIEVVVAAQGPGYAMLMLPYHSGGPLYNIIGKNLDDLFKWRFFIQLLSGVEYLHDKRIVHRDIKSDNILLWNNDIHLADFGLAENLSPDNNLVEGFAGTDKFVAPEVLANKRQMSKYDGFKADIFAVGIVLWSLLMEIEPDIETKCLVSMRQAVLVGKKMDPCLVYLNQLLLAVNPEVRPSVQALVKSLKESELYQTYDKELIICKTECEIIDVVS